MMLVMVIWLLLGVVTALNLVVFIKLRHAFRLLQLRPSGDDADNLPSVTVCIAARNETHAMTQCLERVVATEYPKLEVIVLDDGSRDNTSMLIKSFAHAGVRFIEGSPLPNGWLGKNYAQSVLAREASGEYVFFMDVDTLIERHTIARAVAYLRAERARMVSIIPIRSDEWRASTLMSTMRHFWTIMRFEHAHSRAAANAWLVERELLLERFASDQSLPLSMEVETTIARHLAADDKYRLVLSNKDLGLRYEKRWTSQVETSLRLLYPQCGRHWYQVAALIGLLALGLTPYILVFLSPWALLVILLQYLLALYYLTHVWAQYRLVGAFLLPVTFVQEVALLFISTYRYNFSTITWKGRPIQKAK